MMTKATDCSGGGTRDTQTTDVHVGSAPISSRASAEAATDMMYLPIINKEAHAGGDFAKSGTCGRAAIKVTFLYLGDTKAKGDTFVNEEGGIFSSPEERQWAVDYANKDTVKGVNGNRTDLWNFQPGKIDPSKMPADYPENSETVNVEVYAKWNYCNGKSEFILTARQYLDDDSGSAIGLESGMLTREHHPAPEMPAGWNDEDITRSNQTVTRITITGPR